jgi:hypothetical protein
MSDLSDEDIFIHEVCGTEVLATDMDTEGRRGGYCETCATVVTESAPANAEAE